MAAAPMASLCIGRGRVALHKQQPTGLDFFVAVHASPDKRLLLERECFSPWKAGSATKLPDGSKCSICARKEGKAGSGHAGKKGEV